MKTTTDTYIDHPTHKVYRKDCSSCWTENMVAKQSIRSKNEELGYSNQEIIGREIHGQSGWSLNPIRD